MTHRFLTSWLVVLLIGLGAAEALADRACIRGTCRPARVACLQTASVAFRDGRIVSDQPNPVRRMAADELAALPDDDDAVGPALNILRRAQVELAEQEADAADAAAEAPDPPLTPPPAADKRDSGEPRPTTGGPPPKE